MAQKSGPGLEELILLQLAVQLLFLQHLEYCFQ